MEHYSLILPVAISILLLLFLVIKSKIHAFISLLATSFFFGIISGMPLEQIIESIQKGMGGTLGFVAVVVGLGAIMGKLLEISGSVEKIAVFLLKLFGESKSQWALSLTGFIIAIPVFFDVGFIILVPIVYGLSEKTNKPLLYYALPLLAGLSITHSFIPPTPGPIAVADLLNADLGWVILFGFIAGSVSLIIAGPGFAKIISRKINYVYKSRKQLEKTVPNNNVPGLSEIMMIIFIPIILILSNTISGALFNNDLFVVKLLKFIGHPFFALLLSTLLAYWLIGVRLGYSKSFIQELSTKALEPAGIIILITGAGGVFKQILIDSGAGQVLGESLANSGFPLILLAFTISAVVRIIQGSATVAMITAAGLIAPISIQIGVSQAMLGLTVISIASGATILSHVNDSGFWLVNRYLGLSEKETLKSWTFMTTLIAFTGLVVCLIISFFI